MAGLRYVQADDPGLSRRRRGRGFSYRDAHGRPVDAGTVRRIDELAIPPAWRDVWICPDELGHILATGQDDRGRKQYLYHPKWRELRDLLNFYRLIVFANHLPEVRAHVQRQLRRRSLDRSRVLAAMVRIIDASAIRIGSEEYAEDNDSFGLTTLTRQHARVDGRRIELRFPAKSGSRAELTLSDPGIARLIAELKQQRARRLFTVGGQPIDAVEVNALLSELTGEHITAKDFRTWKGTLAAFSYLREQVGDGGDPDPRGTRSRRRSGWHSWQYPRRRPRSLRPSTAAGDVRQPHVRGLSRREPAAAGRISQGGRTSVASVLADPFREGIRSVRGSPEIASLTKVT